ncbi:hypothetical protein V1511DRAFT_454690 [Dipodascopsis uninucleata]
MTPKRKRNQEPVIRFQLNYIDSYQSEPGPLDIRHEKEKDKEFYRVPVIRVFGNTDAGEKICVHIHGVYPYLFIEYKGGSLDRSTVSQYIQNLESDITASLQSSVQVNPRKGQSILIAKISLCKAVPFYGFHVGWKYYLKISALSPSIMGRIADLLRSGGAMGTPFEVYEAHLPYLLQFMIDFNLYGCGWITCSQIWFRSDISSLLKLDPEISKKYLISPSATYPRSSYCAMEIDIEAKHILNRYEVYERNSHHILTERLSNIDNTTFRYVHSLAKLWKETNSRRRLNSSSAYIVPSMSADESYLRKDTWTNEDRLWSSLRERIKIDSSNCKDATFDTFSTEREDGMGVPTAFQILGDIASKEADDCEETFDNDSFWENIDPDDISFCPPAFKNADSDGQTLNDVPAYQVSEKRKLSPKSSSSQSAVYSLSSSNEGKADIRAKGTISILDFANLSKSAEQARKVSLQSRKENILSIDRTAKRPRITSQSVVQDVNDSNSDSKASKMMMQPDSISRAKNISTCFDIVKTFCVLSKKPMKYTEVMDSLEELGEPRILYKNPFYSLDKDVPKRPVEYGGREIQLKGGSINFLKEFDTGLSLKSSKKLSEGITLRRWQYCIQPPSFKDVENWISGNNESIARKQTRYAQTKLSSQIEGPTQQSPVLDNDRSRNFSMSASTMSVLSLEVHINTRNKLRPDPLYDEIKMICWEYQPSSLQTSITGDLSGVIFLSEDMSLNTNLNRLYGSIIDLVHAELDVINKIVDILRELDPDIVCGFEVQNSSWGYIIDRARIKFDYDLPSELSRMMTLSKSNKNVRWGAMKASSISITGRHVLNIWRLLQGSVNLLQYSFENCAANVLKTRVPFYEYQQLTEWFESKNIRYIVTIIDYYSKRASLDLKFLKNLEIIEHTAEQAQILGVDFYSVISRGSQFKVESLMFRIAKAENFMLVSPSRRQVGHQNALECLPLVMEPASSFYTSPVVVLDFQSLYPSIMIAYNYCYSTCLGRVESWRDRNKLGVTDLIIPDGLLNVLKDHVTVSPNGMVYAKPHIRRSLLARMLTEILETRVMVKNEMKDTVDNNSLKKILNHRQLALKLIANVTYGYTSASFSGRMPCAEIADSIVQSGRETLERAIDLISNKSKWAAEVVYGDTDSLFVHLPGRSKEHAFRIGREIAEYITNINPNPVKLKLEKVYVPCVLLAKKRYVGFMYETEDQVEPVFDAKGIETVRRDGTIAEQKIEEKALKILFRTSDLSAVKRYFQDQCQKIIQGRVSIKDFCFSKEVRMGTYKENGVLPAGAMISSRKMQMDPRAEPQYGERVPYVVTVGRPGARLVDRCIEPEVLMKNSSIMLDAEYYITKNIIPPLERIFCLVGANIRQWYDEMPRNTRGSLNWVNDNDSSKIYTMRAHMKSTLCIVCRENNATQGTICSHCRADIPTSFYTVSTRSKEAEKEYSTYSTICRSCSNQAPDQDIACVSKDCPIYYYRVRSFTKLRLAEQQYSELESQTDGSLSW